MLDPLSAAWPPGRRQQRRETGHPATAGLSLLDHSAVMTLLARVAAAISRAAVVSISEISPAAASAAANPASVASRCPASRSAVTSRAVPTNSKPVTVGFGRLAELQASHTVWPPRVPGQGPCSARRRPAWCRLNAWPIAAHPSGSASEVREPRVRPAGTAGRLGCSPTRVRNAWLASRMVPSTSVTKNPSCSESTSVRRNCDSRFLNRGHLQVGPDPGQAAPPPRTA